MKRSFRKLINITVQLSCYTFLGISGFAQMSNSYLNIAEEYYSKGDYYSAAKYYDRYLSGEGASTRSPINPYDAVGSPDEKLKTKISKAEIIYKAGDSYQQLHNYQKAEPYFKDAVAAGSKLPLARYWYAKSLRANSKFDLAKEEFHKFLQEYNIENNFAADAGKELASIEFLQKEAAKNEASLVSIQKLLVNTAGATSAPATVDNMLVFSSTSAVRGLDKTLFNNRLYSTGLSAKTEVIMLKMPEGETEQLEGASFTKDGKRMYVTKWALVDGKKAAAIYLYSKRGDRWVEPELLENVVNVPGFNSQQPFVSPDGAKLYFASNKPGGLGSFDIWVASLNGEGKPFKAINLGPVINTTGDEYAPFFHTNTNTLVFSTNSRTGMGGFDFFETKVKGSKWSEPVNLGFPINSAKDDIYFNSVSSKYLLDSFYFSSDRNSECCLELYGASKTRIKKRVLGTILNCLTGAPMEGVQIKLVDAGTSNAVLSSKTTNADGNYEITMDELQSVTVKAEADGYVTKTFVVNITSPNETVVKYPGCLEEPHKKPFEAENKAVIIPNIYFDFNEATIKPESYPVLDSVAGLMERYPTMSIEVSGHADSKGSAKLNLELSEARAKSFAAYLVSKGIEAGRIETKGFGESRPIASNITADGKDNPEGREKNRRTEIKVLHY